MNNLLISFFRSATTAEEDRRILAWLEENPENLDTYVKLRALHFRMAESGLTDADCARSLRKLHGTLNQRRHPGMRVFAIAAALAALLALPLCLRLAKGPERDLLVYDNTEGNTTMQLSLPDGSSAMLSQGSKLTLHPGSFAENRELRLDGEAFFYIAKDAEHPLLLELPLMKIKVLGTSFNARNYPGDAYAETTLAEGSVMLLDSSGKGLARLRPGQSARYGARDECLDIFDATPEDIIYMKYGIVTLKEQTMDNLLAKVGDMFNVRLKVVRAGKGAGPFTLKFTKDAALQDVMRLIEAVSGCTLAMEE